MAFQSQERLTIARRFFEPTNSTHRQYEALRAYYVEGIDLGGDSGTIRLYTGQLSCAGPSFLPGLRNVGSFCRRSERRSRTANGSSCVIVW